jgi:hypothetical protein
VILWVETSQPCRTFRTCNPTLTMFTFTCWTDSCLSELIFCTSVFNCCKLLLKLLLLLRRTMWWIFNRRSTFYRVTKCCHVSPRLSKNVQICHDFTNDVKHVYHSNAKWWTTFVRWWNACALIFERNSQLKNIQIFDKVEGDSSWLSFGQCFLGFSTHGNKITFI